MSLNYLETLGTKKDIEESLGKLPPDLANSYGELFRQKTASYAKHRRRRLDVALSFLLLPKQPPAHIFLRMLYWEDDEEDDEDDEEITSSDAITDRVAPTERPEFIQREEDLINLCFNFVVFDSTTTVFRFAHSSVQEYLLLHSDGYFSSEEVNHARVAEHCISIMLQAPDRFRDNHNLQPSEPSEPQDSSKLQNTSLEALDRDRSSQEYWYLQVPPMQERSPQEDAMLWTRRYWAYFVVNSGKARGLPSLKTLEDELDEMVMNQPWESVRSSLYFSACRFGLESTVKSWTKVHMQLIRTRQLLALETIRALHGTPLEMACVGGQKEIVDFLIDNGADMDYYSKGLPWTKPLTLAISERHEMVVKLLLERGASTEFDEQAEVRYPLHYATLNGQEKSLSLVRILVEHGVDIDVEDSDGATAVARAVAKEDLEIMHYLLERGAKTTLTMSKGGITNILHWSTRIRSIPEVSLAMAALAVKYGADVNHRADKEETPIYSASRHKNLEVMRLILTNGGKIDAQDSVGRTSLVRAIQLMKLISHDQSEAKITLPQSPSSPPAFQSEYDQGYTKAIELLITSGADIHIREHNKWNALNNAAKRGHENIVRLLLDHGADITNRTSNGWPPVLNAANEGHEHIIKLLLGHGAKLNVFDEDGWTPLHCAAREGNINILRYLVDAGIKVEQTDSRGDTALLMAANRNKANSVRELLRLGADPNAVSHHGISALAYAAEKGNLEIVNIIIPLTSNINSQDADGDTALSAACSRPSRKVQLPVIKALLDAGADIAPRAPGPHSAFLDPAERMEGFALDALLKAWSMGNDDVVRTILESGTKRDPDGEYAKALGLLEAGNTDALKAWMEEYKEKATGEKPDVVTFRDRVLERKKDLNDAKKQEFIEAGLADAVEELDIREHSETAE